MSREPLAIIGALATIVLLVVDVLQGHLTPWVALQDAWPLITLLAGRQLVFSPATHDNQVERARANGYFKAQRGESIEGEATR